MTDHNIIWPVLVHAFTAVLLVFFWKRVTPQRVISIAGCTVSLAIGVMFGMANVGTVIAASLLIGLGVGIGTLLCFIPGLIVAFFAQFYVWFIVDRQLGAIDAIKASFGFVNRNLGSVFIFYLASLAAYFVGALACGIGLLVAVPVVYIAQGYTYRKLQGGYVAP